MDIITVCLALAIAVWTIMFLVQMSKSRHPKGGRPPPGPFRFPIVGNMLQLGRDPHRAFAQLSKIHGPLMSIKVGSLNIVVVSSPEMAKELLTKHDQAISGRFTPAAMEAWEHHKYSMATLPVGTQWRKFRRISKEQLFLGSKLEASQGLRREKLQQLFEYVKDCCIGGRAVNIEEIVYTTTLNQMSATLLSLDLGDLGSESIRKLKGAVEDVVDTFSAPNLADFFPILKRFDLQGIKRRGEASIGKVLAILEEAIKKRLSSTSSAADSPRNHDILEALLDLKNGTEYDLNMDDIKHLLLDLLLGGVDLISTAVDWAMTELLLNPSKMAILKNELRTVIGEDKQVEESDMSRLPYLQAVVKEVLRYHTPGPLLVPRKAVEDVQVKGFLIPKDTQILFNTWCMGRDSNTWPNPDSFQPERFLEKNIDFVGKNFELIPFGSGRRICPGMPLANRMLHLLVAFLVHNFDWKMEEGKELDVSEQFGLSLRKRVPLVAVPFNSAFQRSI